MLEASLLKQSLHFSLLGLPVYQNKDLVFAIKDFLCLLLPYISDLGVDDIFLSVTQITFSASVLSTAGSAL